MNHYYTLDFSYDPLVTGINDGSPQAEVPIKFRKKNFNEIIDFFCNNDPAIAWSNIGAFPPFEVDLEYIKLKKKAKLTDFLDVSPIISRTFLVSDRTIRLLQSFELPAYRVYKARLYNYSGIEIPGYHFLYIPALSYDVINFNQTIFYTGTIKNKRFFNIACPEEFEKLKEKEIFDVELLAFNEKFNKNLDFFCPRPTISQYYISNRLREAFQDHQLSGVDIKEPSNPKLLFT